MANKVKTPGAYNIDYTERFIVWAPYFIWLIYDVRKYTYPSHDHA